MLGGEEVQLAVVQAHRALGVDEHSRVEEPAVLAPLAEATEHRCASRTGRGPPDTELGAAGIGRLGVGAEVVGVEQVSARGQFGQHHEVGPTGDALDGTDDTFAPTSGVVGRQLELGHGDPQGAHGDATLRPNAARRRWTTTAAVSRRRRRARW